MGHLQQVADELGRTTFLGGPVKQFETAGRLQLITLLRAGLEPASTVLDIGCGALRGGYWLIHFLDPGCYFGIEPNAEMLQVGREHILEPGLERSKQPRFSVNSDFDVSSFDTRFDFFLARSVWTHASRGQIRRMLEVFTEAASDDAVFLASYLRAGRFRHREYTGEQWVGRSHESNTGGLVYHSFAWIDQTCREMGLVARELEKDVFNRQTWLRIEWRK